MQVDLSAKQLFVIKLALAQLEPVDANVLNETRQLIDSSINLYPGDKPNKEQKKFRELCYKCPHCLINPCKKVYECDHPEIRMERVELHDVEFTVHPKCPLNRMFGETLDNFGRY